jgi:hypothetical protein
LPDKLGAARRIARLSSRGEPSGKEAGFNQFRNWLDSKAQIHQDSRTGHAYEASKRIDLEALEVGAAQPLVYNRAPLRNTTRCIEAAEHQCLDVASIDAADKGKGRFTRFLTEPEKFIDENRPSISIYVENALEPRFQGFLRRRPNYVPCNPPDVCFIRRSPESHQLR